MKGKYLTQTTLQREGSMKVRKKSWRKLTWRITNPFNFRVSFRDVREFLRKNFNCMTRPMKFLSSICHKFSKWDLKGERFNNYHLRRVRLRKKSRVPRTRLILHVRLSMWPAHRMSNWRTVRGTWLFWEGKINWSKQRSHVRNDSFHHLSCNRRKKLAIL